MSKLYDMSVVIGRFQPFHNGHLALVKEAAKYSNKILILIGSAYAAPNIKNPFTFEERADVIAKSLYKENIWNIVIQPLADFTYNDELWVQNVQRLVSLETESNNIALVGHTKDESSFYLKLFPQWDTIEVEPFHNTLSSTQIREKLFKHNALVNSVPEPVELQILKKNSTGELDIFKEEYAFIEKYKKSWENAPYAPTFWTTDAVVIQQGHILMVVRGAMPGKGLWALPGGFVDTKEYTKDACIRELREETKLKVPTPVLKGSIVHEQVFDAPSRSLRGRTITMAFLFHLTNYENGLPKVKGGDDAAFAKWVPLSELKEQNCYEDHYHIIQTMLAYI